jgi:gas vesicle protein
MRLLTGILTVAVAGVAASIIFSQDSSTRARTKRRFSKESSRLKSDVEKTINEGIYNLLDTVSELIEDYSKRSQKSIKQAKKRKRYISL